MDTNEKQLLEEFLSELDEGEQLGFEKKTDTCSKCCKSVDTIYHYHYENNAILEFMYCENCDESWGCGWEDVFKHIYLYFVENKELFCIKRENMFIEPSAYIEWKKNKKL